MGSSIRPWISKVFGLPVRTKSADEEHHRRLLAQAINELGRTCLSAQTAFDTITATVDIDASVNGSGAANATELFSLVTVSPVPFRVVVDVNLRLACINADSSLTVRLKRSGTIVAFRAADLAVNDIFPLSFLHAEEDLLPETAYTWAVDAFIAGGAVGAWRINASTGNQGGCMTVRVEPQLPEIA